MNIAVMKEFVSQAALMTLIVKELIFVKPVSVLPNALRIASAQKEKFALIISVK
jgi:hypothetical protein